MDNMISRRAAVKGFATCAAGVFLPLLSSCARDTKNRARLQQPWVNDAEFIGYFMAAKRGYYRDEGLAAENMEGGPDIVPELVTRKGNAEICLTTPDNTFALIAKQGMALRIIGAQYQKSPMGIISLGPSGIREPRDLIGKRVAVPSVNTLTFETFLRLNNIIPDQVLVQPYNYDPTPLVDGNVDATLDFVTNVAYTVETLIRNRLTQKQAVAGTTDPDKCTVSSFLLADKGFPLLMDTVVVTESYLRDNRSILKSWLRASRRGWQEVFKDPESAVKEIMPQYLPKTQRQLELEISFCRREQPLIDNPAGIFHMSQESIRQTITSLSYMGINGRQEEYFDNSLVEELERA